MTNDPEDLKEEETDDERNQLAVSMDEGLFDVFDDDMDEGYLGGMAIDYDALSFEGASIGESLASSVAKEKEAMPKAQDAKPAAKAMRQQKKKRQSLKIEQADRGLPPPRWHSEAADKLHRKAIQMEIAKLLQMRKTTPLSEAWLQQLPHKVRKLEERLYRSAPSLEAYLDRKSLKERLKTVAKAITQQFQLGKMRRSSTSSLSSFGNVSNNRDSISSMGSLDSLQTLQRMMAEKTVLPMTVGSASNTEFTNRRPSIPQSSQIMNFTQQSAASTVGDAQSVNGDARSQTTGNGWHANNFQPGMPLARPLPLPVMNSSHNAMNVSQNSQGDFGTSNSSISNQAGLLNNNAALFSQPMNMMMLNSANTAQMNSALGALQIQQRQMQQNQMQYALNTQQSQLLQQNNPTMMRGGTTSFGLGGQQASMPYFMSNGTADTTMPPPPSLYPGTGLPPSASAGSAAARPRKKKSAKSKK